MRFPVASCCQSGFNHWLICQHQVEIEVWPSSAEVYFRDERFCDPSNTQVRFQAGVYNAPDAAVLWEVHSIDGGPGQGQIDATGLYTAPDKNSLPSGHTEIITAIAKADPLRRAYALVTLLGRGPEPPPRPTLSLTPKRSYLYYGNSKYIDSSNKHLVFRALVENAAPALNWNLSGPGALLPSGGDLCRYSAPNNGSDGVSVVVTATLQSDNTVKDQAEVVLVNYSWFGF